MDGTELIANLFRISQTEEKLRKDEIDNAETATSVHYSVGREVWGAIEKIGGWKMRMIFCRISCIMENKAKCVRTGFLTNKTRIEVQYADIK